MTRSLPPLSIFLVLAIAVALVVAGGITIGFAPTITLLAVAATALIFYLMIHISLNG